MTALIPATRPRPTPALRGQHMRSSGFHLTWRLLRRGELFLWIALALYMAVEVFSFRASYPDEASRQKLLTLTSSTAVRMLQGVPAAADKAGGFAVWDGGWMLSLIVAAWAVLTVSRMTRGEEDSGRAELVLCRPVSAQRSLIATFGAIGAGLAGIALATAAPFVVLGESAEGALLWGAGVATFGAVMAAVGALCAQLLEPRRRVVSIGLGLVAAAFLLRAVANSADDRGWMLSLTPFGWLDRLQAFADNRWYWLAAPAATALVLGGFALLLCARRDAGAALRSSQQTARSRLHMLGSAGSFGWRQTSGALLAWMATSAVTSLVFGLMTGAVVDFLQKDDTYRQTLESMGMDMSDPVIGFVGYIALFMALPLAAFAGWRIGAARQEEAEGRLDNLLVRGVVRWRWLTKTGALAVVAATFLVSACGVALFVGARLADVNVGVATVAQSMAGTLPLVALFIGVALLVFGLAPRLTVIVPVSLAVFSYLLDTFGAMLHWPAWVLGLSPFHHLARLPGSPLTFGAGVTMVAIGLLAAVAGIMAFTRRDLRGE